MKTFRIAAVTLVVGALLPVLPAAAQPLGSFRWQLQPYCNIVTVSVVQQGGQYQLDGTDDQCGAAQAAGVRGLAFQNPNGSIGFGLAIVTAPGGTPVHVDATITIATLSGTWRDSAGNNGTFIFTPGAGTGGGPRPVPSAGIAPASITNIQIANNAVTTANVVNGSLTNADLADGPRANFASGDQEIDMTAADTVYRSVTLTIPAAGRVVVNASAYFDFNDTSATVELARCSITTGTALEGTHFMLSSDNGSTDGGNVFSQAAATRGFVVAPGSFTVNFVCSEFSGNIQIQDTSLTAIFIAS
jgi:hypothetical protein